MKSDCAAILMAIDGQTDLLQGLFGSPEKPAQKPEDLPPLTQGGFSTMLKKMA